MSEMKPKSFYNQNIKNKILKQKKLRRVHKQKKRKKELVYFFSARRKRQVAFGIVTF